MFYLTILMRALLPYIYCLLAGASFSVLLRKRLMQALPIAFCTQIVIMMLSSMLLGSMTIGIGAFIAFCSTICAVTIVRGRLQTTGKRITSDQIIVFTVVYFAVYVANYAKCFDSWDEFSHWGHFVKETFRLDNLFCTSPLKFVHKDYVPSIPLFEALWCKLSLGYSEANTFRAIQILQLSMIFSAVYNPEWHNSVSSKKKTAYIITESLTMLCIPLLFSSLNFYHTICVDLAFGVMIFFCMWLIVSAENWGISDMFSLVVSLSVLILSKMTAFAFLPMIVCFFAVIYSRNHRSISKSKYWMSIAVSLFIPFLLWIGFNHFMTNHNAFDGGVQGYGHFTSDLIVDVFSHNGAIPYQTDVEKNYIFALFKSPIVGFVPYVWTICICVAALIPCAKNMINVMDRKTAKLIALWNTLAGIAYATMMWFLYLTAFSESEARNLASYERYMSSYLIAIMLLDASFIICHSRHLHGTISVLILIAVVCLCTSISTKTIDQMFPGNIGGFWLLEKDVPDYEWEVSNLRIKLPPMAKVYVISVGNTESSIVPMGYYLSPMSIYGSGLDFVNYKTMTTDSFIKRVAKHEYIYVRCLEDNGDDFMAKYSKCFSDPSLLYPGAILKIDDINENVIECDLIDEISLGED